MRRGVATIALQEARRYVRFLEPKLLAVSLAGAVGLALLWPLVEERGLRPGAGLYAVEIDERSPLLPAGRSDPQFRVEIGSGAAFLAGRADLLVVRETVHFHADSDKSRAAAKAFELAVRRWLDDILAAEADADAAFPVRVNIAYLDRALAAPAAPTPQPPAPAQAPPIAPTPASPGPGEPGAPQLLPASGDREIGLRPDQLEPRFPLESLLLTFAYIVPLNFLHQLYGGALLHERTRHRGVPLLAAPVSSAQILLGKTVPYAVAALGLAAGVTVVLGADLRGFLAMLPVVAFGLASTLLLALLARSPRELTFLLVGVHVLLSTFLFLPAIFSEVHPVAFLSPVTVLVAALDHEPVGLANALYATVPTALVAAILATLAVGLYREEPLFAPQRLLAKMVEAVRVRTQTRLGLLAAGALAVPFAIGLELFVLIFAVTLDVRAAFVVFLLGGAFLEEALKALPIAAAARAGRRAWTVGALVGGGFFLGEKLALAFSLLGLGLLPYGRDALATYGVSTSLVFVVAPLLLHMATATITAQAARVGRRGTLLGWPLAALVHAAYNGALILGLGGGRFA